MRTRTEQNAERTGGNGFRFRFRYLVYFTLALLMTLALASYTPVDAAALSGGTDTPPDNWIGVSGAFFAQLVFNLIGLGGWLLIGLLWLRVIRGFLPEPAPRRWWLPGALLMLLGTVMLLGMSPQAFAEATDRLGIGRADAPDRALPGGVIGQWFSAPMVEFPPCGEGFLRKWLGAVGTLIIGWALLTGGAILIFLSDWLKPFTRLAERVATPAPSERDSRTAGSATAPESGVFSNARAALNALRARRGAPPAPPPEQKPELAEPAVPEPIVPEPVPPAPEPVSPAPEPELPQPKPAVANTPSAAPDNSRSGKELLTAEPNTRVAERGQVATAPAGASHYELPSIFMLSKGVEASGEDLDAIVQRRDILQRTLDSFKIDGKVTNHISGPRITRYEITLSPGVKTSKVESIADNIAMELEAKSIRVLAPIPGRNAVGVEAPNSRSEAVFMRSVMESEVWQKSKAEIPIVLGKNVAGTPVILDLAKAPHLLIAGSTGSGKSVCMNTLIMSLLFKFSPEELRLIMVDPKVVEFAGYQTLPHLITPVVNDSKKVPIALRWAVNEMEKRYRTLARAGVKKLSEYNRLPPREEPLLDDDGLPLPEKMPVLVVIVDELADLMMTDARKDAETSIARIAQKGRAAGIHIVIATQRPSRDIITGVIKANLPTKIAFMVGSSIDSRVILDQNGAESLLGMGDMLFLPPGTPTLERIQGAWVQDEDIKKIVDFVSAQAPQKFDKQVVAEESESEEEPDPDDAYDDEDAADVAPLIRKYLRPGDSENLRKALEIILLEHKASTSYLQRRMGIGYNRAAELIDQLEERGIVGPPGPGGSKREILVFDEIEG